VPAQLPQLLSPATRLELLAPGSLVCVRGMARHCTLSCRSLARGAHAPARAYQVQDMFDPEFYVGAWRLPGGAWRTAKYCDALPPEACADEAETVVWERRVFHLVPVPGEARWAQPEAPGQPQPAPARGAEKRRREACGGAEAMDSDTARIEEGGEKRQAQAQQERPESSGLPPLPPAGRSVLLKVYGPAGCDVRLSEVLDCVAVLSLSPESTRFAAGGEDFPEEAAARNPPHSAVPRAHALLLHRACPPPPPPLSPASFLELREACVSLLRASLGGDGLAAEYLLLHLLSRVHGRSEPVAVGALSLGLRLPVSASDADCAAACGALQAALGALCHRSVVRPLSVDSLNAKNWAPRKDYASNTLQPGELQVAEGTQVRMSPHRMCISVTHACYTRRSCWTSARWRRASSTPPAAPRWLR